MLQVFTVDEERALEHHLLKLSKMFYGLTKTQVRHLAFEFAKTKIYQCPVTGQITMLQVKIGFVDFERDQEIYLFVI